MAFVQQLPKAVFIHMQKYCTNIIISFLVPIKQKQYNLRFMEHIKTVGTHFELNIIRLFGWG